MLAILAPTNIDYQEFAMNKDQSKGSIRQVKGQIKETTGKVFGDKSLENKGKAEKVTGKIQKNYGNLKEDIKDTLKKHQ